MDVTLFDFAGYGLNPYAFAPGLTGLLVALFGVFVLLRERASTVSIAFCGMTSSAALWLLSYVGIFCAKKPELALVWSRIENLGVVFIPLSVFLFMLTVTGKTQRFRWVLLPAMMLTGAFAFSVLFTNGFVAGVRRFFWGFYPQYGWLPAWFLVFFASLLGISWLLLYMAYRTSSSRDQAHQMRDFLKALGVGYLGSVDYLAAFGWAVYPFGYLPALVFLLIVGRTLWRYRLTEITPAFAAGQILKTMLDGLIVIDREGIIRLINPTACQLLDRSEQSLIGKPLWSVHGSFFTKERLETFLRARVIRGYTVWYESPMGQTLFLELAASSIPDSQGEPSAVVFVVRDLTHQRRAEETLRHVQEELRAIRSTSLPVNPPQAA